MGAGGKTEADSQQPGEGVAEISGNDIREKARWMEVNGRLQQAAKLYGKLVKLHPFREENYSRLIIIYRKQKDYKNELRVINLGIKNFKEYYTPSFAGKDTRIIRLSRQLNKMVGLTDKKGNSVYEAGPIGKWKKRKELVLKKLRET